MSEGGEGDGREEVSLEDDLEDFLRDKDLPETRELMRKILRNLEKRKEADLRNWKEPEQAEPPDLSTSSLHDCIISFLKYAGDQWESPLWYKARLNHQVEYRGMLIHHVRALFDKMLEDLNVRNRGKPFLQFQKWMKYLGVPHTNRYNFMDFYEGNRDTETLPETQLSPWKDRQERIRRGEAQMQKRQGRREMRMPQFDSEEEEEDPQPMEGEEDNIQEEVDPQPMEEGDEEPIGTFKTKQIRVRDLFYKIGNTITQEEQNELMNVEEGLKQWCDDKYNIFNAKIWCPNGCRYCYVKRTETELEIEDLERYLLPEKRWRKARKKPVMMFPTVNDIFPRLLKNYIQICGKILRTGRFLIIATKPRKNCIEEICERLAEWKHQILFRFSITTTDDEMRKIWEPKASSCEERIKCLQYAREKEFNTSVAIEPFLTNPIDTVRAVNDYVTDGIWIGLMEKLEEVRKKVSDEMMDDIENLQSQESLLRYIGELRGNDMVFWKDTIVKTFI